MNSDNFKEFLERIGHKVIRSESGYWYDTVRSFYENIPFFKTISPCEDEIGELFRKHHMIGIKYSTSEKDRGKSSCVYICQDTSYDLKNLHPKMRNKVRQGLKNCLVREIDFNYLHEHGMPLNRDTLERQGRDDPIFSQPARWKRFCDAGKQVEGTAAWGAFVDDQLAAYMVTFVIDGYSNILYQMSRTELLPSKANNALAYVVTKEMLSLPEINYISYGQESIRDLPGLDEYKIRLGYEKWPMNYVVILHPLLRTLLMGRLGDGLLGSLSRLVPNNDTLKRVRGIVDIAKSS